MKNKSYMLLLAVAAGMAIAGCKTQTIPPSGSVVSLTIVDALPTSTAMIPVQGTTGPYYTYKVPNTAQYGYYQNFKAAPTMSYGTSFLIGPAAGDVQLYLVQKNADTVVANGHVSKYMFNQVLSLPANSVHSLFITGKDTTAADYLLTEDLPPVHPDSTAGIRFVNLSAGSSPVSVDIQGQTNGSEVQSLAYKSITGFKSYAANHTVSSYTFEFRDAASGTLLATYKLNGVNNSTGTNTTVNNVRFKNLTIALIGQPAGGTVAQQAILINNF